MKKRAPVPQPATASFPQERDVLLTAAEVASLLKISRTTVWRLANAGRLPDSVSIGSRRRWKRRDIEAMANAVFDTDSASRTTMPKASSSTSRLSRLAVDIDAAMLADAETIFTGIGIDTSTAVRMFLAAVVSEHGIPFQPRMATTKAAAG